MLDVVVTYALFASGITANKYVLNFLSPVFFVGARMFAAGLVLLGYQLITDYTKTWRMFKHFVTKDLTIIALITFCTTFIPSNLKSFSLKYLPASKATLLGSIDPFVTALIAYVLWHERLSWAKVLGILLGCIALAISIVSTSPEETSWQLIGYLSYPEIAQLIAVIISRCGWIAVQKLLRSERYAPAEINSLAMLLSGACSLSWGYTTSDWGFTHAPANMPLFWGALLFTIFFGNVVGYTLYCWCLKRHNTTFMSLAGFLVPLFVAGMSNILLGETLSLTFFLSAGLLFVALAVFYSSEIRAAKVY